MAISPVAPSGTGASAASITRASQPEARPTEPSLRSTAASGFENEGATVSVSPMVSMMPMPKACSNARRCSGGNAAEALRQKRMRVRGLGHAAFASSR